MNVSENLNGMNQEAWSLWLTSHIDKVKEIDTQVLIYTALTAWFSYYLMGLLATYGLGIKVPFVGYRSFLEPTWFVRLRFVWAGGSIINEGYQKVSHRPPWY